MPREAPPRSGWVDAVVEPRHNAMMAALARAPVRCCRPRVREARRTLVERALAEGPRSADGREKAVLLADPMALVAPALPRVDAAAGACDVAGGGGGGRAAMKFG